MSNQIIQCPASAAIFSEIESAIDHRPRSANAFQRLVALRHQNLKSLECVIHCQPSISFEALEHRLVEHSSYINILALEPW